MPWIGGGGGSGGERWRRAVGAETLIPGYIHGVTEPRFFGLNDFDSDSARRNEINRVPFVLLTAVAHDDRLDASHDLESQLSFVRVATNV